MDYVVFSIRDRAANIFAQPFFQLSVASGIRAFSDAISSPEGGLMSTHPEDFDLFQIGTFNDHHAKFTLLESPVQVALGRESRRVSPDAPAAGALAQMVHRPAG